MAESSTILLAFLTGLTTGGLSCFAVQGGLLTSSIASFTEQKKTAEGRLVAPILLFLAAKLIAYTILGLILGWVGTMLMPSPVARGFFQLGIAIFLIGNGLRMLDVHPFFRHFAFEPPRSVTRMIRKKSKSSGSWFTPVMLGTLTVLIPCGVTQVMMVSAVSTGSPWSGAAILFAFVLGASPTFFGVTYLATRLSALFEKNFMRILGTAILLLGFYSLETGLNLVGSPVSMTKAISAFQGTPRQVSVQSGSPAGPASIPALNEGLGSADGGTLHLNGSTDLTINVYNTAYSPNLIYAPADKPLNVKLVTDGVYSCSLAFVIPAFNMELLLANSGEKTFTIPPQPAGTELDFMCSMAMFTGQIIFE